MLDFPCKTLVQIIAILDLVLTLGSIILIRRDFLYQCHKTKNTINKIIFFEQQELYFVAPNLTVKYNVIRYKYNHLTKNSKTSNANGDTYAFELKNFEIIRSNSNTSISEEKILDLKHDLMSFPIKSDNYLPYLVNKNGTRTSPWNWKRPEGPLPLVKRIRMIALVLLPWTIVVLRLHYLLYLANCTVDLFLSMMEDVEVNQLKTVLKLWFRWTAIFVFHNILFESVKHDKSWAVMAFFLGLLAFVALFVFFYTMKINNISSNVNGVVRVYYVNNPGMDNEGVIVMENNGAVDQRF